MPDLTDAQVVAEAYERLLDEPGWTTPEAQERWVEILEIQPPPLPGRRRALAEHEARQEAGR